MSDYQIKEYRTPQFEKANVMMMEDIPPYEVEDYDLFNEKEFKKYISDIEKLVRSSMEYQIYIQYLRQYMDMNASAFLRRVNNVDSSKVRIEVHHTPFTLFDIAMAVFNKRSRNQESLEVELVAKEVAYIHYMLYVGLVPLSKTEHILVHNQALFVPMNIVLGHYEQFINLYEKDIPPDAMERYNIYKEMTEHYNHEENTKVLEISPTYLQLPGNDSLGAYSLPELNTVLDKTKNRLLELKSRNTYKQLPSDIDNIAPKKIKPFTIFGE